MCAIVKKGINLSKYRNTEGVFANGPRVQPIIQIVPFLVLSLCAYQMRAGEGEVGNYFYRQAVMTN